MSKTANALKELGVGTGDRVAIYMPMIPELPIAMLACARLGAPHTVIFGGFSAESLAGPHRGHQAKLLITADGGWRRGKPVDLKDAADEAVAASPSIEHMLVVRRLGDAQATPMTPAGRDVWWHDIVDRQGEVCPPVPVDSEHMLYLLYTSGTTARPKGIIHTSAGYLLGTSYSHEMVFDIKPNDVYWCAADIGWVTGHSYIVYGPLANATTGRHVRGRARHARLGSVVADRRGLQGHGPLYGSNRDTSIHEAGRSAAGRARPVLAATARLGGRAHQPRGVAVVPPQHRP